MRRFVLILKHCFIRFLSPGGLILALLHLLDKSGLYEGRTKERLVFRTLRSFESLTVKKVTFVHSFVLLIVKFSLITR